MLIMTSSALKRVAASFSLNVRTIFPGLETAALAAGADAASLGCAVKGLAVEKVITAAAARERIWITGFSISTSRGWHIRSGFVLRAFQIEYVHGVNAMFILTAVAQRVCIKQSGPWLLCNESAPVAKHRT